MSSLVAAGPTLAAGTLPRQTAQYVPLLEIITSATKMVNQMLPTMSGQFLKVCIKKLSYSGIHKDGAKCVLRIRYNISTFDFNDHWHTYSSRNGEGSILKTDPTKDFLGLGDNVTGPLRLEVDTSQFGRTFQDRSHVFQIRKRPPNLSCGLKSYCNIINVNVRGRRGNIVQTYPSVEVRVLSKLITSISMILYPRTCKCQVFLTVNYMYIGNDLLHIQWTGSDANSQGNAGQGRTGTDRV